MAQMCPAKSTIVPFKKQMYSSGSIILSYKDDKCICVSIHAPTRGCDAYLRYNGYHFSKFQSTHPRGVRLFSIDAFKAGTVFQSTHPRGVRRIMTCHELKFLMFQSTHPRGVRRSFACGFAASYHVSIHAPTRGATDRH